MKINLETMGEGVWVEWKDGVRVKLRPLATSKTVELRKAATKKTFEFLNGRRNVVEETDDEQFNDLLQEHLIEDWDGFYDQNDKPVPCNAETKKAILDYFHEFRLFAVTAGQELEQYRQAAKEEAEKNS